jgi:LemA protein
MANLLGPVIQKIYQKDLDRLKDTPKEKMGGLKYTLQQLKKYPFLAWCTRILLLAVAFLVIWILISTFNQFSTLLASVNGYYADLGKELKRRENLIPNILVIVNKYAAHETKLFKYVCDARERLKQAKGISGKIGAIKGLDNVISGLLALFEQYPDLKATQSAQDLIKELTNTENRIAEAKSKYNRYAESYNKLSTCFPGVLLGRLYGFPRLVPYVGTDKDVLKVPNIQTVKGGEKKDE